MIQWENADDMNRDMEKAAKEYGWVVQQIQVQNSVYSVIRTMGLQLNYGHADIEIMLHLDMVSACRVLGHIAERIQSGYTFEQNKMYHQVLNDRPVIFVRRYSFDKDVLRMIVPDDTGIFPGEEGCEDMYRFQNDTPRLIGEFDYKDGHMIVDE